MEKGLGDLKEEIRDLREGVLSSQVEPVSHEEFRAFQDKVMCVLTGLESRLEALATRMETRDNEVRQELAIYKTAVAARVMATREASRVEVPKPQGFSGKRDAKELDNFLWHMERYFEAIALTDEATKVRTATLYLTDTATLWWRRRFADIEKGICTIDTWEDFKREIKRQFYPEDVAYLARKRMRRLKHTGLIRDYVKEFSSLMLEIPNMTEEELMFNFMDNLQSWAEQELRRRGVQDLATAMAIAESLTDYRRENSSKVECVEDSHTTGGGDEVLRDHGADRRGSGKTPNSREGKGKAKEFVPKTKCFLCDGPHWARDCPKRKALNAMVEEKEQEIEAHMGSMQLLGALQVTPNPSTPKEKKAKGERAEVAHPHMEKVTEKKVKSVGKKRQSSKHRRRKHQHLLRISREKEVDAILAERVTRRQGVPPVIEYLVRWKGQLKGQESWERVNASCRFCQQLERFRAEVSTRTSTA